MIQNKITTIVSEIKDFFTSSEKAINTILAVLSSLILSEKKLAYKAIAISPLITNKKYRQTKVVGERNK